MPCVSAKRGLGVVMALGGLKPDTYVPSSTCGRKRAKHAHGVGRGRMRHIPITYPLNVPREVNDP